MSDDADNSMRRDILSAYAASGSRVVSWVIVLAFVYRRSPDAFAVLSLVRGTIGILNYTALGLLPAMIGALAQLPASKSTPIAAVLVDSLETETIALTYATPATMGLDIDSLARRADTQTMRLYSVGNLIAVVTGALGLCIVGGGAMFAETLYNVPYNLSAGNVGTLVFGLGFGVVIRWLSDPAGAVLQARGRILEDNLCVIGTEAGWVVLTCLMLRNKFFPVNLFSTIVLTIAISSLSLLIARQFCVSELFGVKDRTRLDLKIMRPLLATGAMITLAQLADYLYSPTDLLLINHLLTPLDLTHYAPAVQIDSGLLLLVTALGSVLLPKTALAHAAGNSAVVRTYYLRGTLASAVMLIVASLVIYFASPLIFRLWFGDTMPGTVAILPLVLLNTVIGGSSAVGRAILIGIGKTKPFAISVLIAGVTNVIASLIFVRYFHLGLNGIILGTIVAVVLRCGIWMPWYVLRELRIK